MKKTYCIIGCIVLVLIAIILVIGIFFKNRDTVDIKLMTNGGVPYEWEYKIEDESVVKLKNQYSKDLDPELDGGRVELHYVFEALKEGKTMIVFKYKSVTGEDDTMSEEKYLVNVDKDLNITIDNGNK